MSSSINKNKRPGTIDYSKWDSIDIESDSDSCEDNRVRNHIMDEAESKTTLQSKINALMMLCKSKQPISLQEFQEKLEEVPKPLLVENTHWFHHLCENENVTLELVKFALSYSPGRANSYVLGFCPEKSKESWAWTYPLHLACCNSNCPNSVIKLLVEKDLSSCGDDVFPPPLQHMSVIHEGLNVKGVPCGGYDGSDVQGLPLHYYLSREKNVDINIVKLLVTSHPQSLTTCDEDSSITPLHVLFYNKIIGNLYDIVEYLVDYDNRNLMNKGGYGYTPLHVACENKNITPEIVTKLLNACPPSLGMEDDNLQRTPIGTLCDYKDIDDSLAIEILKVLIEGLKVLQLISRSRPLLERDCDGFLPIYHAFETSKPAGFIKLMLEACPELEEAEIVELTLEDDFTLLHYACEKSYAGVVKYLLERGGSYDRPSSYGRFPIHIAASRLDKHVFDIIKCLLTNDPSCAAKETSGDREIFLLPLHYACYQDYLHPGVVKLLYNAYPEAVFKTKGERPVRPIDCINRKIYEKPSIDIPHNRSVKQFIIDQMNYLNMRKDRSIMTTPDEDGFLPLDRALSKRAPLGTIKELLKAYPKAIRRKDPKRGFFPLHIACYNSTVDVVKYLVELEGRCLDECDHALDYPLHNACITGNYEVINYLLDRQSSSVSKRNVNGQLPIHLLCISHRFTKDNESPEYVGTVYRLLLAQPDVVMNW